MKEGNVRNWKGKNNWEGKGYALESNVDGDAIDYDLWRGMLASMGPPCLAIRKI